MPGNIAAHQLSQNLRCWSGAMLLACCTLALPATAAAAQPGLAQFSAADADGQLRHEISRAAGSELRPFYAARAYRPLWIGRYGQILPAALTLLAQIESAQNDGLKPSKFKPGNLNRALRQAESGDIKALAKAELALSKTFAAYVKAMRATPRAAMSYENQALAPVVPTSAAALSAASASSSLDAHIAAMGWMHPLYAPLRQALGQRKYGDIQRRTIWLNLERVRALPAFAGGRNVLIDAASARLWMYEGGRAVDSMKVVVGKRETPTPTMAGFMRYAVVNPYWNLPDDMMPSRVTTHVLQQGPGFITAKGFQILPNWDAGSPVLDPRKIDWQAVASGAQTVRARQLPGPENFMGKVKFMFPNRQGIYLHDTPDRALLVKDARQFSNGCVRLEDAQRFGRWLMGKPLPQKLSEPEQRIDLPEVVPVYITYLTALPQNGGIAFLPDVYGRDVPATTAAYSR